MHTGVEQPMGVQRDGAMTEYISVPRERVYVAQLSLKELCLVEPLTVGFHAVARGRVDSEDAVAVFGCGAIGLGAIAGAALLILAMGLLRTRIMSPVIAFQSLWQ